MAWVPLFCVLVLTLIFWKHLRRLYVKDAFDNIAGPPAKSFWKGSFHQIFDSNGWEFHRELTEKYGRVVKVPAMMGTNWLYTFDPKAMHQIFVKEQDIFEETSAFIWGNKLVYGPGLISTMGEQHRKQRKMLNPVFSAANMREMLPTFYDVVHKLQSSLEKKVANGPQELDVLHWMTRTSLELLGQSGLGWSFDNLTDEDPTDEYSNSTKQLVPVIFNFIFTRNYLLPTLMRIGSPRFRRWIVDHLPGKNVKKLKNIVDTLHNTSLRIYEAKKKAIMEGDEALLGQVGRGKDIMSILMKANMNADEKECLTEEEVLGQMSTMTVAGMDTTSAALSRTLHLLAQYPEVQEKLRQEILEARVDGQDLSYETLESLPYLDAICRETLRLYSPASMVIRTTREDAVLPLSQPIKGLDGKDIHEIPVPKNTKIIVSILGSNRNSEMWGPDSYEWKPERWLQPLPVAVTSANIPGVYSNIMSFIAGGRSCIGFKFSQLEMKVVLSLLLQSFRFSLGNQRITWKMFVVVSPTVRERGEDSRKLPLIIERLYD